MNEVLHVLNTLKNNEQPTQRIQSNLIYMHHSLSSLAFVFFTRAIKDKAATVNLLDMHNSQPAEPA